jgi:threonine dehydrogenase-like Zn-dependent dehydrogenase
VKALVSRHSLAREAASAVGGRLGRRAVGSTETVETSPTVITHRFPLERWDEAVLTVKDSRRTGAIKVLLEPAR